MPQLTCILPAVEVTQQLNSRSGTGVLFVSLCLLLPLLIDVALLVWFNAVKQSRRAILSVVAVYLLLNVVGQLFLIRFFFPDEFLWALVAVVELRAIELWGSGLWKTLPEIWREAE